jgi:hypothetical protein
VGGDRMVSEVKQEVANRVGLVSRDCYMHYNGRAMPDGKGMMDCCDGMMVVDGATVHLCVRQKGGCFIITFSILTLLFFATLCAPFTCGFSLLAFMLLPLVFILPWCCL